MAAVRKETIGNATLYLGDCRDILPTLGKVDAVITDPPYGINFTRHGGGRGDWYRPKSSRIVGDSAPFNPAHILALQAPTVMWGANHYCNALPGSKSWIVWDKRCGMTPDDNADAELAWTNTGKQLRVFRSVWRGAIRQGEENIVNGLGKQHPAQKPVELMKFCIDYAGMPETVVDPYMGSGTTGIAAHRLGRRFIGIEIDPTHFQTACERIENAQRQERLFA